MDVKEQGQKLKWKSLLLLLLLLNTDINHFHKPFFQFAWARKKIKNELSQTVLGS